MSYVIINGGKKLHGVIQNQSAKNSAVAIFCAAAAVRGRVTLTAVPQIEEVYRIVELLKSIGVQVDDTKPGIVALDSSAPLKLGAIDRLASEKTRASLLLFGALAAREPSYKIYKSGGCKLGNRTVRPHLYALENFGVEIISRDRYYEVINHPLRPASIVMYESGDTATANAVLAAALAPGVSIIKMASANYQVQDLCYFLNQAGAKISGIGATILTIVGVKKLRAVKNYRIMPDPIVAMTYIAAGLVTRSTVTVANCPLEFLELELYKLQKMGARLAIKNRRYSENGRFVIVDVLIQPSKLAALPDKIEGRPFPGLNMDNLPLFVPILALAKGRTLVHDWAFENRAVYHLELQKLGVKVTLLDPHRVWIEGPAKLTANEVVCPPALRPAVNILIAMLGAKGRSVLRNTYEIDRGYENLYETLNRAGADIVLVKE